MWGEFCEHYPLRTSNEEIYEVPNNRIDKGTVKEFKFLNYIISIYKKPIK